MNKTPADILIVDDTPENLRLLSRMLTKQGYNVRKAISGQMALRAVNTAPPNLILLDIMMPQVDGYEVCQQLKNNPQTCEIPIIFLSALDDVIDKVKAFKVGGVDYITKPFHLEEVLIRIQNQLSLQAAEKEVLLLNTQLEMRVQERTKQLEEANAKLLEMALHDSLTGLANRVLFMDRLKQALDYTQVNSEYKFAVMFLDCDRFKVVNDSLGHLVGDELLIAISGRLQKVLKPEDTLARLGGDEFGILQINIQDIDPAVNLANQIFELLSYPFKLLRHEVFINASIGITLGNNNYEKPEYLLRDADTAMYQAKASGKARYHIFTPEMHNSALQLLQLETDLRRAINQQEFIVYYQPIIEFNTGKITGFEALVRWYHPQRGIVSPGLFIPIAEETGLINPLGNLVMREACHQLYKWQQQKITDYPLTMSINLSVRQFAQPNLIEQVDKILTETQVNPQNIKLEITESAIMENTKTADILLKKLRERYIKLCIDDFGTGYSSLSYLHLFPVDTLKIDRSFIWSIDDKSTDLGLVPAIISIAKTMRMNVVAEGIETPIQFKQLKKLKCDFGQGFLFSKPLEAEKITQLLKTNPQWQCSTMNN
ncbi:MAG: EAL domain-containing protein [Okeania sp. SIO2C9]|uniref:two-component system response regulator n=1 Tax=Okeania sp. SIO2C9 TaxID=2607791 RepID=UPI0013C1F87F|nr:GGDEF domain-containing response regulator [Okeania sp. SIO2C9]NEQ78035.1 EAL domain-containing protein [Okeania sp. SIO2C9]